MCAKCESNENCHAEEIIEISDVKYVRRIKFKNCFHGLQFHQCKSCQMVYFLLIQKKHKTLKLLKDLNKIIFSYLVQPITHLYCCRCQDKFEILTPQELKMMGWSSGHIMADGCDSHIKFSSASYVRKSIYEYCTVIKNDDVLIESGDGSKYGQDGFTITAGFFTKNNKHLTIEETKSLYNIREKASICDLCIHKMIENGEIGDGGGINERYYENR